MSKHRTGLGLTQTLLAAMAVLGLSGVPGAMAQMDTPNEQVHRINLKEVEIADLIEDVSIITGYTFIVHPQVRGRVTVTSQAPLTTREVFDVFLATLRVHQFVAVPAGDRTYRIVPEQTAASDAEVMISRGDDAFVTQILKLNYFSAVDAATMIKPVINPAGQVVANKNSNTVVVVDYASNMARVREIVRRLDEDQTVVKTISLKNVPASEMEALLNDLDSEFSMNFRAVASDTTNTVVVRGEETSVLRAVQVATQLDSSERARDNIRVISLNNAKAVDIVPVLERLGGALSEQANLEAGGSDAPTISAHEPTNSIVISADYEMLEAMERVVAALDVRRPQVMVEALVVEMSDDAVDELGLQFVVSGTDGSIPFATTNYSRSAPNMLALTGALAGAGELSDDVASDLQSSAISSLLGLEGISIGGGGVSGDTLFGVILNAVKSDVTSNILSTPMAMVVDNETASIIVGQEVPVTTGSAVGSDLTNAFVTIERKDVGVQLDVTPQIGEGDVVKLQLKQEASNIAGSASSGEIITNKRSIETTVLADDGEIIVLGGLVEQTRSLSESKVPLLGDLPAVGNLFKSRGDNVTKTNLMVFIRPTIVRDTADAKLTTVQKYRYLQAQELIRNEGDPSAMDQYISDVFGAAPPDS
ncbi:type II secretion system secretin GspD [Ponticaulis profundi]|uniref:Type II secretion system secretin GspD n=1 Tax=Ponticaulis profundi TaxID=2665222 RepID=A0ABW1S8A2_9PROT